MTSVTLAMLVRLRTSFLDLAWTSMVLPRGRIRGIGGAEGERFPGEVTPLGPYGPQA